MKQTKSINIQLQSSGLIIVSAFFYATYGIWSKLMAGQFGEFNQAWIRAIILLIITFPLGLLMGMFQKVQLKDLKWFVVIALFGGLNQAPYFYGFEHLPVGTATLLFYVMLTVGVYVFGKLFFQEKLNFVKYFSLILAVIGLSIIYQFSLSPAQVIPAVVTCISGFMGAGIVIFSKKLSHRYSELQILTGVFIAMIFGNLIFSLLFKETLPPFTAHSAWLAQLGYAAAMLFANVTVFAGFKHLEPSIGGLLGLLEVLFAAVFGILFFGEHITVELIIGGVFILVAAGLADMLSLIKQYRSKTGSLKPKQS